MNAKEKALHDAYIQLQANRIIQEPDSQKAAQMAYNLIADINDADIGQKACKALFDRDRAQQKNEAPTLAAAVGNDLLRAQLSGQIEFADSLELDAFARGDLGINGFNQQYHAEASPDYERKIHQAVADLVEKHNALSPAAENDPDITADMAQDFLELCTAEHYSEASMNYLASQKQVILGDQSYKDRLVNAIKSYDKPPNSPKDYVAPEPSEERLNDQREKLANNWTNNNSALRVVNPAIVSRAQERIPGDPSSKVNIAGNNKNWAMGVQIAQETISKYGNKVLFVPEHQVVKKQVADKVFTPQNKEKVAGMHARLNRENLVPALNLIQGSQADQEFRAKQMNEVREQAVEQRLAEIRKLTEANGLSIQSLGILDEQQKPKEAKQLSDMAEEASANFDKLYGKAEAAVSELNAKEATMRAAVYQSQAQVLRSANKFLEVGTPGVDAENLESVKRAMENLRDITAAHQAVVQQVEQVRAPLYSESIRQAVTPVLQGQGFTPQEIEVVVSASISQLDAALPEIPTDPEMAAGVAGAMAQNLQSCGSKLSAVDSACSKIHNAVGQAFNVSIVPQPDGGILLQPALEGAPYGALSLNEVNASIQKAAAQQGVSLHPDKGLHEQMTPAPILRAGADMTRSYVSPDAQSGQASDTFRVRSQQPLDDAGSQVAFAKNQVGSRISRLKAAGGSESQVQLAAAKDCLLLDTVSPLYGRSEEVGSIIDADDMEDKLALKKEALQGDPSSLISRSVASSAVNKALSMNSLAEEKFGFDENNKAIGVSVGVSGAAILNTDGAEVEFLDIEYDQDWVQKGLSDLQVQDYITGQIDRHSGNIFIDPNSQQVKGIDNDLAFPLVDREEMFNNPGIGGKAVSGLPSQIHEDTADKIEALSPAALREQLESLPKIDGVAPLEPAAIDGAVQRLENLQNHVKDLRQQGLLISSFNKETYEQAKSAQIAAAPDGNIADTFCTCQKTSYLGTAIVEQAITNADDHRKRIKQGDVKPRINEPHATFQKSVNEARANALANPSSAPTADLADRIAAAKEKVANLEKQLAAQDQDLRAVNNRLNNAEKLGRQQIVAPLRAAYQQVSVERREKLQALKAAKQEMDAALDAAVEPQKPALAQKAAEEVLNSKISNQNDLQAKPDQSQVKLPKEEVAEEEIKLDQSVEIPLTESQITEIEAQFAELDNGSGPLEIEIEDGDNHLAVNESQSTIETPNEVEEYEQNLDQEDLATEEPKQRLPKQMQPEQIREALQNNGVELDQAINQEVVKAFLGEAMPKADLLADIAGDIELGLPDFELIRDAKYEQGAILEGDKKQAVINVNPAQIEFLQAVEEELRNPSVDQDAALAKINEKAQALGKAVEALKKELAEIDQTRVKAYEAELAKVIGPELDKRVYTPEEKAVVINSLARYQAENTQDDCRIENIEGLAHEALEKIQESEFSYHGDNLSASDQKIYDAVFAAKAAVYVLDDNDQETISIGEYQKVSPSALNGLISEAKQNVAAHGADHIIGADALAEGAAIKENIKQRHEDFAVQLAAPQIQNNPQALQNQTPSNEVGGKKSRVASVRDALRGAASRISDAASSLKTTIGDKLEHKGSEKRLRDVPDEIQKAYKDLQKQLSDLQQKPAADGSNAIDAAVGDPKAYKNFMKGSTDIAAKEKEIKAAMAEMKDGNPALAQLDRSKVGQVLHSGVRDAAKSVGSKLKA